MDCWQHTVRTCLGREITREEVLPTLGRTLFDAFEEVAPGRSDELYGVYKAYQHTTHDTTITLVPGAKETLTQLREAGLRLGVATSKGIPAATRGLNLFGLAPFFEALVTIEDTERHKPYPDPLLVGSERLGVSPAEMIYVGDALVDIKAGKAAAMRTGWVTWGSGTLGEVAGMEPDYIFGSMEDVLSLLPIASGQR